MSPTSSNLSQPTLTTEITDVSSKVRSAVIEEDNSDWETQSEEELTVPRPLEKADQLQEVPHLMVEVPTSAMAEAPSMKWASRIILYSHPNKAYERIIVSSNKTRKVLICLF